MCIRDRGYADTGPCPPGTVGMGRNAGSGGFVGRSLVCYADDRVSYFFHRIPVREPYDFVFVYDCAPPCRSGDSDAAGSGERWIDPVPVSYTHLDVYKRQRNSRNVKGAKT